MNIDMLNTTDAMTLSLACLTLGVILGMIGALKVAFPILLRMRRQIDELECRLMNNSGNNE